MKTYSVNTFIMDSGERFCLVINRSTGLPEYYPNLYLTTQLRNKSDSYSTIESAAGNIALFLRYIDLRDIDLVNRIATKQFFNDYELDDLRDFTQYKFRNIANVALKNSNFSLVGPEDTAGVVSNGTQYSRLTTIANYLRWLAIHILDKSSEATSESINTMVRQIKERRPPKKGRNNDRIDKSLSEDQIAVLFEVIRVGSPLNVFTKGVQRRNRLMIIMLYHLGIRGGELLNIRIQDINFENNQVRIVRRADDQADNRVRQPNAKTRERLLPLSDILVKEIHNYIINDRRKVRNANKHDYLFVTHKSGPTEGQSVSKASYHKVFGVVRSVSPQLYSLTGHVLRHTWNFKFSEYMDAMDEPPTEERQEQIRSYLMGWRDGSGTGAIYNRRFIREKGLEASLAMQDTIGTRIPKGLKSDRY